MTAPSSKPSPRSTRANRFSSQVKERAPREEPVLFPSHAPIYFRLTPPNSSALTLQDGQPDYPNAKETLIWQTVAAAILPTTASGKFPCSHFANETGLTVHVCHYPPGTSKWNAIEHQLFSFISINWRGKPLICYEFMLELMRHTTTKTGLRVHAMLDPQPYPIGSKSPTRR